jgi:hypothetical protein
MKGIFDFLGTVVEDYVHQMHSANYALFLIK